MLYARASVRNVLEDERRGGDVGVSAARREAAAGSSPDTCRSLPRVQLGRFQTGICRQSFQASDSGMRRHTASSPRAQIPSTADVPCQEVRLNATPPTTGATMGATPCRRRARRSSGHVLPGERIGDDRFRDGQSGGSRQSLQQPEEDKGRNPGGEHTARRGQATNSSRHHSSGRRLPCVVTGPTRSCPAASPSMPAVRLSWIREAEPPK